MLAPAQQAPILAQYARATPSEQKLRLVELREELRRTAGIPAEILEALAEEEAELNALPKPR